MAAEGGLGPAVRSPSSLEESVERSRAGKGLVKGKRGASSPSPAREDAVGSLCVVGRRPPKPDSWVRQGGQRTGKGTGKRVCPSCCPEGEVGGRGP